VRFSKKIFIAVFATTFIIGSAIIWAAHHYVSNGTKEQFVSRYSVLTKVLGDTLTRLDANTESLMLNAAKVVVAKDAEKGLLSTAELKSLRNELNVTHIFIIDKNGTFVRSTNEDPSLIPNLFSFSDEYRKLILGTKDVHATPILEPKPEPKPYKFLSVPNKDRTRIVEIGIRVDFIAKTLAEAIGTDSNVISMALYSPDGSPFGRFSSDNVDFKEAKITLPKDFTSVVDSENSFKFYSKVKPSQAKCFQCDKAGTSQNGEYYYVLESEISKSELTSILATTTGAFILLAICNLLLAIVFSRILSRRLVRNIEKAVARVRSIKGKSDLSQRIALNGKDEVTYLTGEFDNLLESMEKSRTTVIEAERVQAKVQMARDIAHNIRSPILAIEMMLPTLLGMPERMKRVLRNSVKEIKGLSEKLSQKNETGHFDLKSKVCDSDLIFLPVFLEEIINQKQIEYSEKQNLEISFKNYGELSNDFVKVESLELKSIISNLINNSIESYDSLGGPIEVSCFDDDSNCVIEISDQGAGIPAEYLNRLGKEQITFKGQRGRGIGLMHAFQTIKSWKGSVNISSNVGIGSKVQILLPRYEGNAKTSKMPNDTSTSLRGGAIL